MTALNIRSSLLFLQIVTIVYSSSIGLDGNGYTGITVAIHKDVAEDLELLNSIKELFKDTSAFLHNTTENRFYFKEVTIVVPTTWSTQPNYEILEGNHFQNAHIRVDSPNPAYKDSPYTLQTGGCGEPGQYIHLTPWFLKNLKGETTAMFGAPERQLVHEWAHYRYGVFDEYGVPGNKRFPMFYQENGKIRPTSCIKDIKGWIESRDGGPCRIAWNGEVEEDCIFIPNMHSNDAKASLMYMPFIPSMEGFCNDDGYKHNMLAPTKHNAMCGRRSTWDVISDHEDSKNLRSKRDSTSELTETLFRVIQAPKDALPRYVLVLDVSGSMNGQPMKLLHSAATRLIEDRIPDGSILGIVEFSTEASTLRNLTTVTKETRLVLSQSLPAKDDGGSTAIGKGLMEAIEVLTNDEGSTDPGYIMLITDGEENIPPFIDDVLPSILKHNVIINAVAFGSDASSKLESLTAATGGRGYFFSNNGNRPAAALDSAFLESITSQADVELQPVQLKDEMFNLDAPIVTKHVYVDEELGKDTSFTITSRHISRVEDVILKSPSGEILDSTHNGYNLDANISQRIQISVPDAEAGKWELSIRRQGEYPVIVAFAVTSLPRNIRVQPIRVRSWLSEIQLKFPAYAKVFAEVKKGYMAIVGATVTATIERPVGETVDIQLRDDGLGADTTENDGVYTGYFTHFNGNGRYAAAARVSNDGKAKLKRGSRGSGSPEIPIAKGKHEEDPLVEFPPNHFSLLEDKGTDIDDEENEFEPAKEFDRSSNTGAFRVENWSAETGDVWPPGDIMDLKIASVETTDDRYLVTLKFTMPGDDLDAGLVDSFDLRASKDRKEIIENFEKSFNIEEQHIFGDQLVPLPAGQEATVTVDVSKIYPSTKDAYTVHFAIKAKDDSGKSSSQFNIASASFELKVPKFAEIDFTPSSIEDSLIDKGTKEYGSMKFEDDNIKTDVYTEHGTELTIGEMESRTPELEETSSLNFKEATIEAVGNDDPDDVVEIDDILNTTMVEKGHGEMYDKQGKENITKGDSGDEYNNALYNGIAPKENDIVIESSTNGTFIWWIMIIVITILISIMLISIIVFIFIIKKARDRSYTSVRSQPC